MSKVNSPAADSLAARGHDTPWAWNILLSVALAGMGFFIPFSTAGVSIALGALIALSAARPGHVWQSRPWREPVMALGLVLLAFIMVHTLFVSGFTAAALQTLSRYKELLVAPLLLALLQQARHRRIFIGSLIAGVVLLALAHWASLLGPGLDSLLATRRISAGFALAVCAFVVLMLARGKRNPWPAFALAALLAVTVLFAIDGRTGHIVLLLLAGCAAWLCSPPRRRWFTAAGAVVVAGALALGSGAVNERLKETLAGSQVNAANGELSPTGIRIELLRLAGDLVRKYAITGAGFAKYGAVHEQAARERYGADPAASAHLQAFWIRAVNPHNEYLMQLIGGGIVALALYVAWLGASLRQAARARAPIGGMLAGVTLAFAMGSLFNSMLMDFVEAHFFVALLAWLLAEERHAKNHDGDAAVRAVLIVATRQIGDVLLTTPLIRAARRRWPHARIEVLGFQGTLGMLRGNPDVDELVETPHRLGLRGTLALARRLWRRHDLAFVTDPGDRAHMIGWLAAPLRSGIVPERSASNWWKRLLLSHQVAAAGDLGATHVTAEKLSLLEPWLAAPAGPAQVVVPEAMPLPADLNAQLAPGAVVVHAPSMWSYKQWPQAHYAALVSALLAQGRQVILTGSASERDQACIAPLRGLGSAPRLLDASGRLDFNQLVTLLRGAALYIGPDTSVSHLAAATGVPVIAIFGPTNPMRWAPWPARPGARTLFERRALVQQAGNVTVLQSGLACVPCGKAGCEDHRQSRSDCLPDITPERVLAQALKVLGKPGAPD